MIAKRTLITILMLAGSWFLKAQSPSVLLITLDTTRADRVGCYGAKNASTPNIDALAARGVLFEEARSHCPLTLPSHAMMLSGKMPASLNLRVNGLVMNGSVPMVQEALKARGYSTVAVVSSVVLEKTRGLSRGFDVYDDRMNMVPKGGGTPQERRAEEVTSAALSRMEKVKGPFFLWVHYYDPHHDYEPPPPFDRKFPASPYDGEIAYMDAQIGRLLRGLSEKGLLSNTLIVVAGDHGEGLGEHGEKVHGIFLYEYALKVPLIAVFEGKVPGGRRVSGMCALSDVAPTIADYLSIEFPSSEGRSLKPLAAGEKWEDRPLYVESYEGYFNYGWAPLRGIMDREYKFLDAPSPELYRYRESEFSNMYPSPQQVVAAMRRELGKHPPAKESEKREVEDLLQDPSNEETLRGLMSLGYLSGAGKKLDGAGMMDPKEGIHIQNEIEEAEKLRNAGDLKAAREKLAAILKRNPSNFRALSVLGTMYLKENRLEEARVCFQEEVRLKPQEDGAHLNLGTVLKKQGDLAAAEKEYRAALAVNPRMAEAAASLGQLLLGQGRAREAKAVLEKAVGDNTESADVYYLLGSVYGGERDLGKAAACFLKASELNPGDYASLANLGQILMISGKNAEALPYLKKALAACPDAKAAGEIRELISKLEDEGKKR